MAWSIGGPAGMLRLPQPTRDEVKGNAGLPVAQGQSWESMSAWAGCRLSEALGDGKSGFGRTRSRLLFIHGRARASAKPPPLAACTQLSQAPAPGAADSLPGWPGRTWGSRVPPPGVPGWPPLPSEMLGGGGGWVQRTASSHHMDGTCFGSAVRLPGAGG